MMQLPQQPAEYCSLLFSITAPTAQALQCGAGIFLPCHGPVGWGERAVGQLCLAEDSQTGGEEQLCMDGGNMHLHSAKPWDGLGLRLEPLLYHTSQPQ